MMRQAIRSLAGAALLACAAVPSSVAGQERENIKVRGHWIVEVRNADGRLVERREFDNALQVGGAALLAQYLTGSSPARWVVELGVYGGTTSPCNGGTQAVGSNSFTQNHCMIVDPASLPLPTGTSVFPTLQTTLVQGEIVLKGNATARVNGQIVYVATRQGSCGTFTAPASCTPAGTVLQFTVHDITPTALTVTAGQIVQVEVHLSFS